MQTMVDGSMLPLETMTPQADKPPGNRRVELLALDPDRINPPNVQQQIVLLLLVWGLVWPIPAHAADPPRWPVLLPASDSEPLPGTLPLESAGDLASSMIEGIDRFLLRRIGASVAGRDSHWQRDFTSAGAYARSVDPNRQRLARLMGISRDHRPEQPAFEYADRSPIPRATTDAFVLRQVRWRAFGDVHGVGLLFEPKGEPIADVIALADAGQTPEQVAGLAPSTGPTNPFALRLAQAGCRVLVPVLIDRSEHESTLTHREWLHRSAYVLGRTLAGYETQKILAAVDCMLAAPRLGARKLAVVGWGEGGRLALYAAALDKRIDAACVSGYFASRQTVWNEPADRTLFGLLTEFGDAEIASLVAPRPLIIEQSDYPSYVYRPDESGEPAVVGHTPAAPGKRGKPGKLIVPAEGEVLAEFARLQKHLARFQGPPPARLLRAEKPLAGPTLAALLGLLGVDDRPGGANGVKTPWRHAAAESARMEPAGPDRQDTLAERQADQVAEIDRHNQWALIDSRRLRAAWFADVKTDSLSAFRQSMAPFRRRFRREVIGHLPCPLLPASPRSRKYRQGPKTISYEVVLDVFPDVFAYGILTLPTELQLSGRERRPVVVCQHGLEGRPQDVLSEQGYNYYSAFATRLAERGFVTFAPQNIYIFHDRFRTLQFKANSIGCTLYSVMVPQHEQITRWLAGLPFVDPERIAFYGLSYGGKSAMRIPPLVDRYSLSICSGDFNEWVWKTAATDPMSSRYTYPNKGEYEIFEFDLGGTFNYAEMAALICPKPFMVERGHFDGVAPDETVGYEYAKVRHLYEARLGIGERTEIEWFVGPHKINGDRTFTFLHQHLHWPKP
jgi:dienelactone hydrolase